MLRDHPLHVVGVLCPEPGRQGDQSATIVDRSNTEHVRCSQIEKIPAVNGTAPTLISGEIKQLGAFRHLATFLEIGFDRLFRELDTRHRVTQRLQVAHIQALAAQRYEHRRTSGDAETGPVLFKHRIGARQMPAELILLPSLQPELLLHILALAIDPTEYYRMAQPTATRIPAAKLRRIALESQGLLKLEPFGRGRNATRRAIEALGYVQIDTISVVSRAHHHVLHSRVPNYDPGHLNRLQADGAIFEYWYHAAAYLPMRDYRFALPRMEAMRNRTERWIRSRDDALMAEVLNRIAAEGPLMARQFESDDNAESGWWNWKPAKQALEQLFMQGDLMVTGRDGFQKTYDLRERVLPDGTDTRMPDDDEMAAYLLRTMLRAHGFITPKEVTHLRRGKPIREALKTQLADAVADGTLIAIRQPCGALAYTEPARLASRAAPATARAALLSPFDNLVIHRDRVQSVFGFDYQIECYVPEKDRRYGYYSLPIAYRDQLIGRADCKAHRQEGRFEIRHLHFEDSADPRRDDVLPALTDAFKRYADFNDCPDISLTRTSPHHLGQALSAALNA